MTTTLDGLAVEQLRQAAGCHNIAVWNDADERTHADVLAAFDRAIEKLEKEATCPTG